MSKAFLDAYIEAALWSSTDSEGEPLDKSVSRKDLASRSWHVHSIPTYVFTTGRTSSRHPKPEKPSTACCATRFRRSDDVPHDASAP